MMTLQEIDNIEGCLRRIEIKINESPCRLYTALEFAGIRRILKEERHTIEIELELVRRKLNADKG